MFKANSHVAICSNNLQVDLHFSDNFVSLTQLTKIGAISAFANCDISCILQVVTRNRIVLLLEIALAFIDLTDDCMINSGTN